MTDYVPPIKSAYVVLFKTYHAQLENLDGSRKNDLYSFLRMRKNSRPADLLAKAEELFKEYKRDQKLKERHLAAAGTVVFKNSEKKASYDKWLKNKLGLDKVLKEAKKLERNTISVRDLREIIREAAFPADINPVEAARHLEAKGYSLNRTLECNECRTPNFFFHPVCSQCGKDFKELKHGADWKSWLEKQSGLISIIDEARRKSGNNKSLDAIGLRYVIRVAAMPWNISPEVAAQHLAANDYKLGLHIKCSDEGCGTQNDFTEMICNRCWRDIGDDYVLCLKGHRSPNLSRFCISKTCELSISYSKPYMHIETLYLPEDVSKPDVTQESKPTVSIDDLNDNWAAACIEIRRTLGKTRGDTLQGSTAIEISTSPNVLVISFLDVSKFQAFCEMLDSPGPASMMSNIVTTHFEDTYKIEAVMK